MKRLLILVIAFLLFSSTAHAFLINRGTDTLCNRLVYDNDRDNTSYDFTNTVDTWGNQMAGADALSVDIGGIQILENHDDGETLVPSCLTTTLAGWDKLCWNYLNEIMINSVWDVRYYLVTFHQIVGPTGTG